MLRTLFFNFNNYNDSIAKGLRYVGKELYFDIIIDQKEVTRAASSCKLPIEAREHSIQCIMHYENNGDCETYYTDIIAFDATQNDVTFTFNLYFLTYERGNHGFDFGIGDIPIRSKKQMKSGGCYVATCVYGSYDCPEVWTLRRYRDYTLSKTWYGRAFISVYYATSPTLVRLFGKTKLFYSFAKPKLDKLVFKLNSNGVDSTPYNDKI